MNVSARVMMCSLLGIGLAMRSYAEPTRVVVTEEVLRTADQLPPLGLNTFGNPGGVDFSAGNIIQQPGFEPAVNREFYLVRSAGVDEDARRWITLDGWGTSRYQLYRDGSYSGADMRAYRIVDDAGEPLPMKPSGNSAGWDLDTSTASKVIKLGESRVFPKGTSGLPEGGWLTTRANNNEEWKALSKEEQEKAKDGWRVYYEGGLELRPVDAVVFTKNFGWPEPGLMHPRTYERQKEYASSWQIVKGTQKFVSHDHSPPAEMMGGDMCFELTPEGGEALASNTTLTSTDQSGWYGQLDPGVTYRYEAWLRSDTPGDVTLGFARYNKPELGYYAKPIAKTFAIDREWKLYGFEFVAPEMPTSGGLGGPAIYYKGNSPLHVDNVKLQAVYEPGDEAKPYVPERRLVQAVIDSQPAEGPKGALRGWAGLSEVRMKSLLSWHSDSTLNVGGSNSVRVRNNMTIPRQLMFMEATGDSPQTRVMPWLIIQILFDEDEYKSLVEYLAAPYDPAIDTPQSKPWAHMRYEQRGHGEPWTDAFSEIVIELGNENWHNRKMLNWIGFGHYGWVHQFGKEYGLFCRYLADQMHESPYWTEEVGQKIRISLGGNYSTDIKQDGTVTGYGQEASQAFKLPVLEGHATYVGPRWELNEPSMTQINEDGFQRTLMGYHGQNKDSWAKQQASNQRLREMGYDVTMVAYEGGPSGFDHKQARKQGKEAPSEVYGKSRAMAVAAFDGWLDAYRMGWTHQIYHEFGQGLKWRSHTDFAEGFDPSPGFLALTLRNRVMRGDMIMAQVIDSPEVTVGVRKRGKDRKDHIIEMDLVSLGAYAMRDGKYFTVALLSRQLEGDIPVEIHLPFKHASNIMRHTLTGGPRDTNLYERKVDLVATKVLADAMVDGVLRVDVPAGNIVVYAINAE